MRDLQKGGLGKHWESGRFSDSSSSEEEFAGNRLNGNIVKKPKAKKLKLGVLGGGGKHISVDAKFSYL